MTQRQSSDKRFALLIDADNVSAKYIAAILDELSKYGTVTIKRIYGDWTSNLHVKWKDVLLDNSITPIQQFSYTYGKNATDSAMIIDAMDILYTNSVDGFCLVSSDSDFTRLASRLRESGLTVIGMGEKKTPVPFRKACDIFTTLELLLADSSDSGDSSGKTAKNRGKSTDATALPKSKVEQAVVSIITDNQNNGKSTGLGEVGSRLLKRFPDFDVRNYGTNQLKKLLDEFESVVITKEGNSVTVDLAEDTPTAAEAKKVPAPAAKSTPDTAGEDAADAAEATEPETSASEAAEAPKTRTRRGKRGGRRHRGTTKVDVAPEAAQPAESDQQEAAASDAPAREEHTSASGAAGTGTASAESAGDRAPEPADPAEPQHDAAHAESAQTDTVPAEEAASATHPTPGRNSSSLRHRTRRRPGKNVRDAQKRAAAKAEQESAAASASNADQASAPAAPAASAAPADQKPTGAPDEPSAQTESAAEQAASQPDAAPRQADAAEPVPTPASATAPAQKKASRRSRAKQSKAEAPSTPTRTPEELTDAAHAYITGQLALAGEDGVDLASLGKRVRTKLRGFKLHDLGYTRFKDFVASFDDIDVQQRDESIRAVLK